MRFGVLGPLRVTDGGVELAVTGNKRRTLLVALVMDVGRTVSAERLVTLLWGGEPPAARSALHNHVLALRRSLSDSDGAVVRTAANGYVLDVDPARVDAWEFEERARRGRSAHRRRQWTEASSELGGALALWRGEPLSDLALPSFEDTVSRWSEQRLQAWEWRIDCDLHLGRYADVVAELTDLVAKHPMREGFAGALMRALHGCGRQADALAVYRRTRETLVAELAAEPSAELQELHQQILAGDAVQNRPSAHARPAPEQLPADIGDFAGRHGELGMLRELLTSGAPLVVVTGAGGIGKTALAVHAAHLVRDRFPDGQLYADLHGFSGQEPRTAAALLARFLRDLGVPDAEIPTDEEELATRYRSLLATRRMLVVLDDAVDAGQVRPLLPGAGGSTVVITSRRRLGGLLAGRILELDALRPHEANQLFTDIVGDGRAEAEPTATAEVVAACGGFPLAVRIAGRRLADRPAWSVRALADRLADERDRLSEFGTADVAVRATFQASYQTLSAAGDHLGVDAARAFRLLGLVPLPSIGLAAAGRLLDRAEREVEAALEALVDAHLLTSPAPGRYRFHDLLRAYAVECAEAEEPVHERANALHRMLEWYCRSFGRERDALVAGGRWAADLGDHDTAALPPMRLSGDVRHDERDEARRRWQQALQLMVEIGDRRAVRVAECLARPAEPASLV